uniref:Glutathione peroxidase n=1 Tax=Anthurium amnicola TaxID=1678845 RepID=A0A1D1YNA4_9ARAE
MVKEQLLLQLYSLEVLHKNNFFSKKKKIMYRNLYRVFPISATGSSTNTTLISLKLLKSNSNSLRRSPSLSSSPRKYFTTMSEFHSLEALDIKKNPFTFSNWKGNVVLIVNVASKCGFTPQYTGLESLYNKYKIQGLVIAGMPCNQFGAQEPGTEEEIGNFCSVNYNVSFPLFAKIDVNGESESPVYKYLKSQHAGDIKWNFEKFLIDKHGKVVKRYTSADKPESIDTDIKNLLSEE